MGDFQSVLGKQQLLLSLVTPLHSSSEGSRTRPIQPGYEIATHVSSIFVSYLQAHLSINFPVQGSLRVHILTQWHASLSSDTCFWSVPMEIFY